MPNALTIATPANIASKAKTKRAEKEESSSSNRTWALPSGIKLGLERLRGGELRGCEAPFLVPLLSFLFQNIDRPNGYFYERSGFIRRRENRSNLFLYFQNFNKMQRIEIDVVDGCVYMWIQRVYVKIELAMCINSLVRPNDYLPLGRLIIRLKPTMKIK